MQTKFGKVDIHCDLMNEYWLVTVTGVVSYKASHACDHFLIYCESPSDLKSFLIHSLQLSGKYQQRHLLEKLGKKRWEAASIHMSMR
jgi:hypothetical protein